MGGFGDAVSRGPPLLRAGRFTARLPLLSRSTAGCEKNVVTWSSPNQIYYRVIRFYVKTGTEL